MTENMTGSAAVHPLLIVGMMTGVFLLAAVLLGNGAFVLSSISEHLAALSINGYLAISLPALVWRKLQSSAIGIDLLTWPETIVNAVIYAIGFYLLGRLLRRGEVSRKSRLTVYGAVALALVVTAYLLEGFQM